MASENAAAWLPGNNGERIEVGPAPAYTPGPGELLLRNRAAAINPVDGMKQVLGKRLLGHLPPRAVLGSDVAGDVVAVGPGVTRFRPGDRAVALAMGMDKRGRRPDEGGFQRFVVVREALAAKLPEGPGPAVSCADACVLPLALATAASGLFQENQLALHRPQVDAKARRGEGRALLVWGASTSVGNCAVQLAAAAGYHVVATASPKNWNLVRGLGAHDVFDYRSDTAVDDIVRAMRGRRAVGALAIGQGSQAKCVDVVARLGAGDCVQYVAQASIDVPGGRFPEGAGALQMAAFMARFLWGGVAMWWKLRRSGVASRFIWASDIVDWDKDRAIFGFVEEALPARAFKPSPEAEVVGADLESVQKGLELIREGVSAKKLVVSLE